MSEYLPLLLGAGIGVLALAIIFVVRAVAEQRRLKRERRLSNPESGILLRRSAPDASTFGNRLDAGFQRLVERTGLEATPEQILASMTLLGVVLGGALYLWRESIGLGMLGLFLGMAVPFAVVLFLKSRQQSRIQALLPDAFYLLARSLRAGMSLEQAIQVLGEDGPEPLAAEFRRCAASVQLGLSVTTALEMAAERIQLLDFNAFVSTVSFQQRAGGNLALLLDRLAIGARDRNQFRGAFWAATAQGRITALALALAAPAMVLGYLIFQPDHVQTFLASPSGWMFLAVVLVLEVIGCFWIYQILKIDY